MKPLPWKASRRAVPQQDLEFIHNWILGRQFNNVLELGCGSSTWAISTALDDVNYVAVEDFKPNVELVNAHIPSVTVLACLWKDIPNLGYDLVFVDSSSGHGTGHDKKVRRLDATKAVEQFMAPKAIVIMHDWCEPKLGYKIVREYLDANYDFIEGLETKTGVGIYQRR